MLRKKIFVCFSIVVCFIYILNIFPVVATTNTIELNLLCENDIAMDATTGNVLYEKNAREKLYPASTTKILTAILALEKLTLSDTVTISQKQVDLIPMESSVMGIKVGEIFTVEQLLYGLLLPSGNDAAIVIADVVSGDNDTFVTLMNQKAKELGTENTHFSNPHGFHDQNHYTTALDMAKIFQYCLQNQTFKKMISTKKYEIPPTNKTNTSVILTNSNRMMDSNYPSMYYPYMIGGKTGYTIEARGTFIGYAKKDGKTVIVGCFNGSQRINKSEARFLDAIALSNEIFDNFTQEKILKQKEDSFQVYDKNKNVCYTIGIKEDTEGLIDFKTSFLSYDLNFEFATIEQANARSSLLSANTAEDITSVGSLNLSTTIGGIQTEHPYPLYLLEYSELPIDEINFMIYLPYGLIGLVVLLVLLVIFRIRCNKKNQYDKILEMHDD